MFLINMTLNKVCGAICQSLTVDWEFSPCIPLSSTNKTERHNIAEILLKVVLNTITTTLLMQNPRWPPPVHSIVNAYKKPFWKNYKFE